jgi:Dual-action HEIGH metallo-peptidase
MKLLSKTLLAIVCISVFATSCKHESVTTVKDEVSPAVLQQIAAQGFSTDDVTKVSNGYLVEGDIVLTPENLRGLPDGKNLVIANEEHYRTTNLVTGTPRKISLSLTNGAAPYFVTAADAAIARYNAQNLGVTFNRVTSGGNINITLFYQVSNILGSSGFPSGGNPYPEIKMNTYWYSSGTNQGYLASIITHEMGHCIGYRHTDYANRAYSCGGRRYNEGSAGVGAIYITGTPTGGSPGSWMLACTNGSDRPFTSSDIIALHGVY